MAKVGLQGSCVGALVRQREARGVSQHMWVALEGHLGLDAGALNQLLKTGNREWRAAL